MPPLFGTPNPFVGVNDLVISVLASVGKTGPRTLMLVGSDARSMGMPDPSARIVSIALPPRLVAQVGR